MVSSEVIKIRVRTGSSEAEIEAELSHVREAIGLIPEIVRQLPHDGRTAVINDPPHQEFVPQGKADEFPVVVLEKNDSLAEIIGKFFGGEWGRQRKKLSDVREALQSYGLNYPKQSVAVALLRLAKSSRIRRFKGEDGEYVYISSTPALAEQQLQQQQQEQQLVLAAPHSANV